MTPPNALKDQFLKPLVWVILIIFFDQFLKDLAFNLSLIPYISNPGLSFGLFPNIPFWLIAIALLIIFLFWIESGLVRVKNEGSFNSNDSLNGLTLILAGGLSNFIDRLRLGFVIDYISLPLLPAFNLADVSLGAGMVLLVYASAKSRLRRRDALGY